MLRESEKQCSFYSVLYERIPENHLLKRVDKAIDFSFVNRLLEGSYCKNFGRPAKEPEMMMKLLFLQYLYNLSDVKVIEEATCNLAFLWFLGLNPEDKLPDASLLAKFRTQRMKSTTLDDVLDGIVQQCVEKELIQGKSVTVDTTHIEANSTKKVPERIMKHLAKRILRALEQDNGTLPRKVNTAIPNYKQIEDPLQAKLTMKAYLEELIASAQPHARKQTKKAIAEAEEILADEKFLQQTGVRSLSDKDARVGHKSKNDQFFGYKTEYTMTTEERIITAIDVHSGEYVDGKEFEELLDRTVGSGVEIKELYGDKAYFRKDILELLEQRKIEGYIPASASVYKIDEALYSYNKDSDQWFCFMGNHTVSCKKGKRKNDTGKEYEILRYLFNRQQCENCPHRDECISGKAKAKTLRVSASAPLFYEASQRQKTEEFKEKYKKRSTQEGKNAELKRFHGLARARGWGLRSITFQAKITAISVNLKRIAAILAQKEPKITAIFELFAKIQLHMRYKKLSCA